MFPTLKMANAVDLLIAYIEAVGNVLKLAAGLSHFANSLHIILCKFGFPLKLTARCAKVPKHSIRMKAILRTRTPLQIAKSIIRFGSVFMVYALPCWVCSYKRKHDETMNSGHVPNSGVIAESDPKIAGRVNAWTENSFLFSFKASDSSVITYKVVTFKTWDWTPLFELYKKLLRHADLSLQRLTVEAGAMARTIRQPFSFLNNALRYFGSLAVTSRRLWSI